MMFWGSKNIKNSVKFSVLLNLFTYFLLIWNPINYLCNVGNNLELQYQHDILLNKSNIRLLAKHETQKDLKYPRLRDKLSDEVNNMSLTYRNNKISTYDHLNKKKLNDLDAYKNGYKNRYSKKKGLYKLDCYCERILFDKIDEIYELSRCMKNSKKAFKKKMYSKFGYPLILFTLSPVFGIIFPALFLKNSLFSNCCPSDCTYADTGNTHTHGSVTYYKTQLTTAQWDSIFYFNMIYYFILCIIILTLIIYTLVKVVKYERLKAGKGNIKGKDYYHFCKNLFI